MSCNREVPYLKISDEKERERENICTQFVLRKFRIFFPPFFHRLMENFLLLDFQSCKENRYSD